MSVCAVETPPDDHFFLDHVDSPEITSDVSDVDNASHPLADDDDWTEETVSVAQADMEIGSTHEDEILDDANSFEEEIVVDEEEPDIGRNQVRKVTYPPPALWIPPLTTDVDTAGGGSESPVPEKKTVKDMIAKYDRSRGERR
jgi:hypothetical protein